MDNLPRYERIFNEMKSGKGYSMTPEEFTHWSGLLRKGSRKEAEEFMKAHKKRK
jgi:hypothetical protein